MNMMNTDPRSRAGGIDPPSGCYLALFAVCGSRQLFSQAFSPDSWPREVVHKTNGSRAFRKPGRRPHANRFVFSARSGEFRRSDSTRLLNGDAGTAWETVRNRCRKVRIRCSKGTDTVRIAVMTRDAATRVPSGCLLAARSLPRSSNVISDSQGRG